jgi:acetyl esterase
MPLEPAMRELGKAMGRATPSVPSDAMDPAEARRRSAVRVGLSGLSDETAEPGQTASWDGAALRMRVTPGPADGPLVLYLHSGGWVAGSTAATQRSCRALAAGLNATVVSLDYPLAPEHPYPAALEQTLTALRWLASGRSGLPGDPDGLILAGESAGGNLAAAALLRLRDEGETLPIAAALLVVPVLDRDFSRPSYQRFDRGDIDGRSGMHWYAEQYHPGALASDSPYVWPLRSSWLGGLPPTVLVQAEYDPLVDEQCEWAARVSADGGRVELLRYPGVGHSFFGLDQLSPNARLAQQDACAALTDVLCSWQWSLA